MGVAADVGPKISSPPLPTAQRCASRSLLGEACLQVAAEVLSWRHRVLKDCEVGHVVEAQGQLGQRQVQLVHAEWGQTLSASPRPHRAVPITTVAVSHHTRTPRLAPNTPCSRPCAPTAHPPSPALTWWSRFCPSSGSQPLVCLAQVPLSWMDASGSSCCGPC